MKFTYLREHAGLFALSGCTPEICTWWLYSRLGAGPYGICIAACLNLLYKASLYVCLSVVMCGEVPQALSVIILCLADTVPIFVTCACFG